MLCEEVLLTYVIGIKMLCEEVLLTDEVEYSIHTVEA
jgi:hypothetical protein